MRHVRRALFAGLLLAAVSSVTAPRVAGAAPPQIGRSTPIASGAELTTDVAYDGTNHLVVWQASESGDSDVLAARVAPDGTVLDRINISTSGWDETDPQVAFDGVQFLVVFSIAVPSSNRDIYGRWVPTSGPTPGSIFRVADGAPTQQHPAIAGAPSSDATVRSFLVTWTDGRSGTLDIWGRRVNASGPLDNGGFVISAGGAKSEPDVAYSAASRTWLVVWEDARFGTDHDIRAARVRGGTVVDSKTIGLLVATTAVLEGYPTVASDGQDFLVVWHRHTDEFLSSR